MRNAIKQDILACTDNSYLNRSNSSHGNSARSLLRSFIHGLSERGLFSILVLSMALVQPLVVAQLPVEKSYDPILQMQSTDACLNDCCIISMDRAWAVGDRGLILATTNGGRTWTPQKIKLTCPLYAVEFIDERNGWIVGGWIQPYTHRSVGIILSTKDGGQTWRQMSTPAIPRLLGIKLFGPNQMICWGDWSPAMQSSLVESSDGGASWSARLLPVAAIKSCAWDNLTSGVLVDQQGNVTRVKKISQTVNVELGSTSTSPILTAAVGESGWWLAGENGQLWRSQDGERWSRRYLPGQPADHRLISIRDLYVSGKHVWAVGSPGNVIWHSFDSGDHWEVQINDQHLPLTAIAGLSQERIMAVGPMARTLGTRNSGRAWYTEHRAGDRLGMLNLSANLSDAAWEAAVFAAWEKRRHAAIAVLHETGSEDTGGAFPDSIQRGSQLQSDLGLAAVSTLREYPVHPPVEKSLNPTSPIQIRPSADLEIVRDMVCLIRAWQPDVLVIDPMFGKSLLRSTTATQAQSAFELAASSEYHLFTPESQIPDTPWKTSKLVSESSNPAARASFVYDPNQMLKSAGRILRDLTQSVVGQVGDPADSNFESGRRPAETLSSLDVNRDRGLTRGKPDSSNKKRDRNQNRPYLTILTTSQSPNATSELMGGLLQDPATQRPIEIGQLKSTAQLQGALNLDARKLSLMESSGPKLEVDSRFRNDLKSFVDNSANETLGPSLLELAKVFRRDGYWNRWQDCLESLLRKSPREGASEQAWLELEAYSGSSEVQYWRASQIRAASLQSSKSGTTTAAAGMRLPPTTPFMDPPDAVESTAVKQASFATPSQPGRDSKTEILAAKVSIRDQELLDRPLAATAQLLSWADQQIAERHPALQHDPRLRLIQGARLRTNATNPTELKNFLAHLSNTALVANLVGWNSVAQQESLLITGKNPDPADTMQAILTNQVPILDGKLDEPFWSLAVPSFLKDPWHTLPNQLASIRFAYDDRFLYIGILCTNLQSELASSTTLMQRGHDQREKTRDHISWRLDIDRDYASWFEFSIDELGQTADLCCDMELWNPDWWVAQQKTSTGYAYEVAVPFSEMLETPPKPGEFWACDVARRIPNQGQISNNRIPADRLPPHGMRLLHFGTESPSKPQ